MGAPLSAPLVRRIALDGVTPARAGNVILRTLREQEGVWLEKVRPFKYSMKAAVYGDNCSPCTVKIYIFRDDNMGAVIDICRRRGNYATFDAVVARLRGATAWEMDAESGTGTAGLLETGAPGFFSSALPPVVGGSLAGSDTREGIGPIIGLACTSGLEGEAASQLHQFLVEGDTETAVQLQRDPDVQNALIAFLKTNVFCVLYPAARLLSALAKCFDRGSVFLTAKPLLECISERMKDPDTCWPVKEQLAVGLLHLAMHGEKHKCEDLAAVLAELLAQPAIKDARRAKTKSFLQEALKTFRHSTLQISSEKDDG